MFVVTLMIVWHSASMLDANPKGAEMTENIAVHNSLDELSLLKGRVKELEEKLDDLRKETDMRTKSVEIHRNEISEETQSENLNSQNGVQNVSNKLQVKYHDDSKSKSSKDTPIVRDISIQGLSRFIKGHPLELEHTKRQQAVVAAFKHAWKGYKDHAWGFDELKPLSKGHHTWFDLGLTLVDSLDTMWLMGLKEEFQEARDWVANKMIIQQNRDVNLFETTIRVLGGLLTAYHFTDDHIFLDKAKQLGDCLLPAFHSQSGVPFSDVNLRTGDAHPPRWGSDSSVSEVTTLQLEFRDLTHITGDVKYQEAVDRVMEKVQAQPKTDSLVPLYINAQTGQLRSGVLTFGARADSYYEYLLKQWLQSGKKENKFRDWYLSSMDGMKKHLLRQSEPSKFTFVGEEVNGRFHPKMDHLVCFIAGTLALGAHNGAPNEHLQIAKELTRTCYQMYAEMDTGLSPEIVYFNMNPGIGGKDITVKVILVTYFVILMFSFFYSQQMFLAYCDQKQLNHFS